VHRRGWIGRGVRDQQKEGVDVALLDVSQACDRRTANLARRLRDEIEDLGVVMVAETRSLEDLVDALRVGVVDYLAKPLAAGELADAVRRAVEWRRRFSWRAGRSAGTSRRWRSARRELPKCWPKRASRRRWRSMRIGKTLWPERRGVRTRGGSRQRQCSSPRT
jgi:DNA-binding response OmpR family regulator